jgi:hypothetical protein
MVSRIEKLLCVKFLSMVKGTIECDCFQNNQLSNNVIYTGISLTFTIQNT